MGKKQKKAVVNQKKESGQLDENLEIKQEENIEEEPKQEEDIKEEPCESGEGISQRNRKARLIVRNLSFKSTEDKVKKFFSPYGDLTDVQILRKPDGRLVGCCFVEYSLKTSAAKAIANLSGKPFLNRPIIVDWAVPKDKFIEKTHKVEDSEEFDSHEGDGKSEGPQDVDVKIESDNDESQESNDESDEDSGEHGSETSEDEEGGDNGEHSEEDDSEDELDDQDNEGNLKQRKPLRESHDISEGCTVFVKNIPFSVENLEFKKCMQKFGGVYYALICMDPLTEHSKGTGFVKFRSKDTAEACLSAGRDGDIVLRGSVLETQPALSRDDLKKGPKKSDVKKDGRNLYLIKEGVILAGSPAASGVSPADMAKRLQLEQWKTQMLRNLNKFVSRNRLVIQNLPPTYDDNKLRALCLKYGGSKPVITEARVMRDFRNVDASGKGRSKEYGFVSFTSHENALCVLRALNNNPEIFTPTKRPIVAFSIEDRKALNVRQKRLEKSRVGLRNDKSNASSQKAWESKRREEKSQINGSHQGFDSEGMKSVSANQTNHSKPFNQVKEKSLSKKEQRALKRSKFLEKKKSHELAANDGSDRPKFMGESAKQGQSGIMSRQKLREQAELHSKMMKSNNKKERMKKQLAAIKIKQPKQKMAQPKDLRREDNFSNLVNKYRTQLATAVTERKKWYSS